jgi:riboflavin-specific deaminase-like protein
VGHLGQSLDGRIATETGVSQYVTGPENIRHMHRLRALADAVVVGAGTVAYDDPRLTTREVDGPNPARVIIDPDGRLPAERQVFNDGEAATFLVCSPQRVVSCGLAAENCLSVSLDDDGRISVRGIVDALSSRGFRLIFVEGGGVTVSRFLEAGALDRLQLTVAPILLGSGRAAVTLPPIGTLEEALRPAVRQFVMGRDLLYDCDLRAEATD